MSNLMERLDSLKTLIQKSDFLEGKGLSNEVNIRIFCYDPKDEMAVRHFTEKLAADQDLTCRLIEYNLYKVFLSICDDKRITDKVPPQEEKKGKQFVLDQMKRLASNTAFIGKMRYEPHEPGDVILITGVGEAFPFIRVHALLDAMQPHFSDVPILVMYPGTFDGHYVKLFDVLTSNPYYRAFNVI
ncbi:MAG: DUF1788 domain-containing protein [Thermoguttaceae bacterium]|nr:DUF1788 domain-containing protein [Thermoguttaceae bacterium]